MNSAREVSKFRRVVAVLAAPDPLVYGGMIFGGASPLLSQALPMVDESPFATLPDSTGIPGEDGGSGGAGRRATALGAGSAVLGVGKAPGLARRRDETALAAGPAASAAPVFSLRRAAWGSGARVEQGRTTPLGNPVRDPGTDADGKREQQGGSERVPASAPAGAGRRIDNRPQLAKLPHKGSDDVGKLKHAPPMQVEGYAAGAALNAALEEVGRLADALVSGAGGSAGSSGRKLELQASGQELRPQAGVGRLKPAPPLDTALEEVGRLAGALVDGGGESSAVFAPAGGELAQAQSSDEGIGWQAKAPAPPLVGGGGESSASFAPAGVAAAAASSGGYPAGQTLGQTANFRQTAPGIHVSPGFAADAEWLAALVNEALAEQARRHGVDLS